MKKFSLITLLISNRDVLITLMIVMIVLMMIIPLPAFLLDFLLSFNIALSIVIFLISLYTLKALDFSIFPSVLLISTLFRLSLNISTTRLILLNGYAGKVIQSFGNFVIGGNFIVGIVVFVILIIVNFVVITQGASRVAEVAARFTLDAMPGKQMSIDADLNAGILSDEDAKKQRKEISRQAEFYGAMDGASKFVRGDATAGGDKFMGVYSFPNPVREDFTGNVTITGLIRNSQIRITDVSGNLVYKTVSDGGEATWDLTTYNGVRVATGVYVVFCSSSDGSQSAVTKILVIN